MLLFLPLFGLIIALTIPVDLKFGTEKGRIIMEGTPGEIFAHADRLTGMGLDVPQVSRLGMLLRQKGIPFPADVIREQFGPRVYALVMSETEDKLPGLSPSGSWLTRKQDSLLVLENTPFPEVKILWLADKLSNIRSFVREHERRGDAMYELLNQKDPAMHAWYYRSVAKAMPELSDTDAYREYTSLVEKLFGREAS